MSATASPAAFTVSDTAHAGPAAFSIFILLIDSLATFLSIKRDVLLTVPVWDKLFLSYASYVVKSFS